MLLMHGFAVAVIRTDVIISKVHSGDDVSLALEAAFSKRSQVTCFSAPL